MRPPCSTCPRRHWLARPLCWLCNNSYTIAAICIAVCMTGASCLPNRTTCGDPQDMWGGCRAQPPISVCDAQVDCSEPAFRSHCVLQPQGNPCNPGTVLPLGVCLACIGDRPCCNQSLHTACPCRSARQSPPLVALRSPSTQSLLQSGWSSGPAASAPPGPHLVQSPLQVCLATNPIWVIKTRLQLQRRATAAAAAASTGAPAAAAQKAAAMPAYRGLVDAARQIARQEGLLGFYKGLVPSLLLVRQKSLYSAACHRSPPSALDIASRQGLPIRQPIFRSDWLQSWGSVCACGQLLLTGSIQMEAPEAQNNPASRDVLHLALRTRDIKT